MSTSLLNKERFNPSRIPNLSVWLDAADPATIVTDAETGGVLSWNDKSGNRNKFITGSPGASPKIVLSEGTGTLTLNYNNPVLVTITVVGGRGGAGPRRTVNNTYISPAEGGAGGYAQYSFTSIIPGTFQYTVGGAGTDGYYYYYYPDNFPSVHTIMSGTGGGASTFQIGGKQIIAGGGGGGSGGVIQESMGGGSYALVDISFGPAGGNGSGGIFGGAGGPASLSQVGSNGYPGSAGSTSVLPGLSTITGGGNGKNGYIMIETNFPVTEVTSSGPAIYFPPASVSMSSLLPISLPYSKTMIAVYRCIDETSSINLGVGSSTSGGSFGLCQINRPSNAIVYTPYQYIYGDLSSLVSAGTTNYAFASFDASTNSVTGNSSFSSETMQGVVFRSFFSDTPLTIGSTNGPYTSSNFYIYEVIVTSNAMSTSVRQEVEGYLANKWNIMLPMNHPYVNFQPSGEQWIYTDLPSTISGLVSWLDMTISGQTIMNIADRTGGNFTIVGSRNTFTLSNINNHPSLNFSGNSAQVETFSSLRKRPISPGSAGTILFVFTQVGPQIVGDSIVGWGNSLGPLLVYADAGGRLGVKNGGIIETDSVNAPTVTIGVPTLVFFSWSGSNFYLSTNGYTPNIIPRLSTQSGTDFYVGRDIFQQARMNMGEMVLYNQYFEQPERQLLEGYLAWKWNIVGRLPPSHPFATVSPISATVYETSAPTIPAQIPSLVTWMDAADTSTITIVASNVTGWRDKSSTNDVFSASTNPPSYRTLESELGPPIPGVYFNGIQSLTGTISAAISSGTGTCFMVATIGSGATVMTGGCAFGIPVYGNSFGFVSVDNSITAPLQGFERQFANILAAESTEARTTTVLFANISTAIGVDGFGTGSYDFNTPKNNTDFITQDDIRLAVEIKWQPSIPSATPWVLGNAVNYPVNQDFYLHEFLCFSEYFSDSRRQLVEGYIAWKWGIQGKLPDDHPYKDFRPQSA